VLVTRRDSSTVEVHLDKNFTVPTTQDSDRAATWAVDDGVALAKALRPALDATDLQPAN